jgi:dTDP-4-dehydrorhamnose 3,5-epimerase
MLYVPEGCAHGYLTLTDGAEVRYLTSQYYAPDAVAGVRYDDGLLGIEWPREVAVVSEQDRSWPMLTSDAGTRV